MGATIYKTIGFVAALTFGLPLFFVAPPNQAIAGEAGSVRVTTPNGRKITLSTSMSGSWDSHEGPWGGDLDIRRLKSNYVGFEGEINFWNSECEGFYSFDGTAKTDGSLIIRTDLGGACGNVKIILRKTDGGWEGSYSADYPDSGEVSFSGR